MSYSEMKNEILFGCYKDLDYWWKLVGEMFERTDGFTKRDYVTRTLHGKRRHIIWEDFSWSIE